VRLLAGLLLSCALFYTACVGKPQVYDTSLLPEEPEEQPVHAATWPVRIVCYNAWILPVFSDEYAERLEQIPAALRALDPDIVILQEVWSGGAREEISAAFGPAS
jgi:hypothetical protein